MDKMLKKWIVKRNRTESISTKSKLIETNSIQSTMDSHLGSNNGVDRQDSISSQSDVHIFCYIKCQTKEPSTQRCEDAIIDICRQLGISPKTRLLFGICLLDNYKTWMPLHCKLELKQKYCLRMRFKMDKDELLKLDKKAHEYLYWQMRYDMREERLNEMIYPVRKDELLGLTVADMYIDSQPNTPSLEIKRRWESYLPRKLLKHHGSAAKNKMLENFENKLKEIEPPKSHTMNMYIGQVLKFETKYMLEEYVTESDYWPDVEMKHNAKTSVNLELDSSYGPIVKLIPKLEGNPHIKPHCIELSKIIDVSIPEPNVISLETHEKGYRFSFVNQKQLENFVTYLIGYMRLTTYWYFDVCEKHFPTPSLNDLKKYNIHGPIGSEKAHLKIRKESSFCGYILRQCEVEYNTYYVDIVVRASFDSSDQIKPESYKIEKRNDSQWCLNYENGELFGADPEELVQQIPLDGNAERKLLRPAEKDPIEVENLLLCYSSSLRDQKQEKRKLRVYTQNELLHFPIEIILPTSIMTEIPKSGNALWQKSGYEAIKVTLKKLNNIHALHSNIHWFSKVGSPHIMKLYGYIPELRQLVFERDPFNWSLSAFFKDKKSQIPTIMCLQVLYSLVRVLSYLHDKKLVHGYLRCANLMVMQYDFPKELQVKLIRPILPMPYTEADLPWVPVEDHKKRNIETSIYTDIWAFATTVYEVISKSSNLNEQFDKETSSNNFHKGEPLLPKPNNLDELDAVFEGICVKCWWGREELEENFRTKTFNEMLSLLNNCRDKIKCDENLKSIDLTADTTEDVSTSLYSSKYYDFGGGVILYKYDDKLGDGNYGEVFKGLLEYSDGKTEEVAVKSFKHPSGITSEEVKMMLKLDHENIVKIKQWNRDVIVMEFMNSGSLFKYLRANRNATPSELLRIALEIAKGMDYLSTKKIVHRDLAARNILLADNSRSVKISDFGLSRPLNDNGYYVQKSVYEVPILWYALEALVSTDNNSITNFSTKSDVWSFGVTLYEIFSGGETPNEFQIEQKIFTVPHTDLTNVLITGARLRCPQKCSPRIYEKLMKPCWYQERKERPSFKEIVKTIEELMTELK